MKDKETIEEMSKDLFRAVEYDIENSDLVDSYATAIKLTKLGWVKPNKDSVVLSREEYEKIIQQCKKARSEAKRFKNKYLNESKETARRILVTGKDNMPQWLIDWIVEQFGVEIKE